MGSISPGVVKDKLAHTVPLEIHRTGRNQALAVIDRHMLGLPTGFGSDAVRLFQTRQPVPFEERRAPPEQAIPLLPSHILHAVEYFDFQLGHNESMLLRASQYVSSRDTITENTEINTPAS